MKSKVFKSIEIFSNLNFLDFLLHSLIYYRSPIKMLLLQKAQLHILKVFNALFNIWQLFNFFSVFITLFSWVLLLNSHCEKQIRGGYRVVVYKRQTDFMIYRCIIDGTDIPGP